MKDDVNLYAYVGNDPANFIDDSGAGKVKYLLKVVRSVRSYYKEVSRAQAVRHAEAGGNVKVKGPGASGKANGVADDAYGKDNVTRHDDHGEGYGDGHYQPTKRKGNNGHVDYEVASPAVVGALAAYGTAAQYLGEDSFLAEAIDFFNPISDIKEVADFVAELGAEESDGDKPAPPPQSTSEDSEPAKDTGDCEISADYIFCWAPLPDDVE